MTPITKGSQTSTLCQPFPKLAENKAKIVWVKLKAHIRAIRMDFAFI